MLTKEEAYRLLDEMVDIFADSRALDLKDALSLFGKIQVLVYKHTDLKEETEDGSK